MYDDDNNLVLRQKPSDFTDEEWQVYDIDIILYRSWNDRNRRIIMRFLLEKLAPGEVAALRHRLESIT